MSKRHKGGGLKSLSRIFTKTRIKKNFKANARFSGCTTKNEKYYIFQYVDLKIHLKEHDRSWAKRRDENTIGKLNEILRLMLLLIFLYFLFGYFSGFLI